MGPEGVLAVQVHPQASSHGDGSHQPTRAGSWARATTAAFAQMSHPTQAALPVTGHSENIQAGPLLEDMRLR